MALKAWFDVAFKAKVRWKGGAPLSVQSKVVVAIAMTVLCLAAFRIYPLVAANVLAAAVGYLMFQTRRDREAYDRFHGVAGFHFVPVPDDQRWRFLCVMDAIILLPSLFAFIRDLLFPPVTEEQHIVNIIGLVLLTGSVLGAIALFIARPKANSDKKNSDATKLPI